MRPGLLRKSAIIERSTETQDSGGALIRTWQTLVTRRMDVRPLKGNEGFAASQEIGEISHQIRLRYDSEISDLSPRDRIILDGRVLHIISVQNISERSREYKLLCKEVA